MLSANLWLLLSLLTALTVATQDASVKKFFSHLSHYEMVLYPMLYSLPLFIITIFFIQVPPIGEKFYFYFTISIPLNALCFVLYNKAIKVSPLSLTIPYLAFTPTFIIGTGYFFLDETPNMWGLIGIITTCVGSYILNIDAENPDFRAPFKAIFKETGAWLMFILAFLFSFLAVFGKVAIIHSSPLFFSVSFFLALNVFLIVTIIAAGKVQLNSFKKAPFKGIFTGLLLYFHVILHGYAISLTKAAYMISVKRMSILFSIIYGGIIFNEKNLAIRFCGALLMFCGAVLIMIKGS